MPVITRATVRPNHPRGCWNCFLTALAIPTARSKLNAGES